MKRWLLLLLSLATLLVSCQSRTDTADANRVISLVRKNRQLLLSCVEEMESFREERIYVAMEEPEEEEEESATAEKDPAPKEKRLVSFEKESGERTEIDRPVLQEAIETLGLELIFYQTASDSRRTVIFSFTRESHSGLQNGFYFSFDDQPSGWWGRVAKLEKKGNRHLQANENGEAWYYTLRIEESFFYYEKNGSLLA